MLIIHKSEQLNIYQFQEKSAIALTRLSSQSEAVSREIIVIGGHLVLARICKEAKLRNYSDAVLVAALAALRSAKYVADNLSNLWQS